MAVPGVRHPQQGEVAKGDWIWLVSRFGASGETIKRAKARVVDVMRKALVLDNIEGRKPGQATVHFNELELMPPELQPENSPTRKKWERRNQKPELVEPIAPPSLTQAPFAGKFEEPGVVESAIALLSRERPASQPVAAAPLPRPRSTPPPAPPPAARPANGSGQRPKTITTDDDEWAAQGREVLRKKVAALEERRATAEEEMKALRALMDGIERELEKSRTMLSMLDENYGAKR
jgi:hypothetical protein